MPASAVPRPVVPEASVPWWRVGVMWLVVGSLVVVVIGSFALLATAIGHADTVLPQVTQQVGVPNTPTSPAFAARNHAATPPGR